MKVLMLHLSFSEIKTYLSLCIFRDQEPAVWLWLPCLSGFLTTKKMPLLHGESHVGRNQGLRFPANFHLAAV